MEVYPFSSTSFVISWLGKWIPSNLTKFPFFRITTENHVDEKYFCWGLTNAWFVFEFWRVCLCCEKPCLVFIFLPLAIAINKEKPYLPKIKKKNHGRVNWRYLNLCMTSFSPDILLLFPYLNDLNCCEKYCYCHFKFFFASWSHLDLTISFWQSSAKGTSHVIIECFLMVKVMPIYAKILLLTKMLRLLQNVNLKILSRGLLS